MKNKIVIVFVFAFILNVFFPVNITLAADTTISLGTSGIPFDISSMSGSGILTIDTDEVVELTGDGGTISIVCTGASNLVLNNVTITSANCPLSFASGNNTLTLIGESTLRAGNADTNQHAGILVPNSSSLTIYGPGTLNTYGCMNFDSRYGGPGIGCDKDNTIGTIIIESGVINSFGTKYGAGIGGYEGNGTDAYILINGGTVNAYGGSHCAGIGGGYGFGNVDGYVTINDGTVTAYGGDGASAIGGGFGTGTAHGYVTINGGTVVAHGDADSSGIGGGWVGNGYVTISNATVTADNQGYASGIGGGYSGNGYVNISNSTVTSSAGYGGAGIGGGYYGEGEVIINNSMINSTGGSWGTGIGGGTNGSGEVTISNSNVTSISPIFAGAGIGGGYAGDGNVNIISSTIDAYGGTYGSAIGGGCHSNHVGTGGNGTVSITDSTVTATSKTYGTGIGSGYKGTAYITIIDSRVETIAAEDSEAGIGCGYQGTGGYVEIYGGLTIARGGYADGRSSAGIGGSCESTFDYVYIEGGQVYAQAGTNESDDIGAGLNGTINNVEIASSAAVFLFNDNIGPLTTSNVYVDSEIITDNEAYGFDNFPDEWNARTGYGYLASATVTYNHNWGTPPQEDVITVRVGTLLDKPTDPTRSGFDFNGWHINNDGTLPFYFDSYPAYDGLILYADWVVVDTHKANLGGTIEDYSGNPLEGYFVILESTPITTSTNIGGTFDFGSVFYINHALYVYDNIGTLLRTYTLEFAEGASTGSSVNESTSTIHITYTNSTIGVNIPLAVNAVGDRASVSGAITFTQAGTNDDGSAINPQTGDNHSKTHIIIVIICMVLLITAGVLAAKRVRFSLNRITQ